MDVNALSAANAYNAARAALRPEQAQAAARPAAQGPTGAEAKFEPQKILQDFTKAMAQGETAATGFMTGGADPHSVVEALASAELAVETAVTLRDKVVEAYQELLRMPI